MRVAYICTDSGIPVFGCKGSSIHVQEIMRALLRRGAEIELFAARPGGAPGADFSAVRIHTLPNLRHGDTASRERSALAANGTLREALVTAGHFDVVYERYSLWSFAGMEYARDAEIPALLEVNAPLIDEQSQHRTLIDRSAAEDVARKAFGAATALIAVSDAVADYLKRFPVDDSNVHVVSNGVDPERFTNGQLPNRPGGVDTFTIGFVGTLKAWHGLPALIEAFDSLYRHDSTYRLLIVGDGPERESLIANLSERCNGLVRAVKFTGAVPPDDIPQMLASMDVAVAPYPPSANFYFSPLKVYEYMAAGLPVVVSRVAELSRLIQDGTNGILCPPGDPVALAEMIAELRRDPQKRKSMGSAARVTVRENHTWDAVLRRIFHRAGIERLLEPICLESST